MWLKPVLLAALLLASGGLYAADADDRLLQLIQDFNASLVELEVPRLQLGYLENLNAIQDQASREQQEARFSALKISLDALRLENLDPDNQYRKQHLDYNLTMLLRRLDLERRYRDSVSGEVISTEGIYHQPLGKDWYQYFLDSWLSVSLTPEELFVFGENEVMKVQQQINDVRRQTGFEDDEPGFYSYLNGERFLVSDIEEVAQGYHEKTRMVQEKIGSLFNEKFELDVSIIPFPESNKDTPPGQFATLESPTFLFNFYQEKHNSQDMDFLVLHEVIPGHWYHNQYDQHSGYDNKGLGVIWAYHGLSEGWGAYVEELGEELGLYREPTAKMGKLKFDLVRSARVVLDVGINYFGWDNQQALDYWHGQLKGQDAIAQREIDRVRRWPGQAISYKVGAKTIMDLRTEAESMLRDDFDIREFHHLVMGFGGVPLFLVEKRVNDFLSPG